MAKYTPGVCNIGPSEIAQRKRAGWIGAIITVVLFFVFIVLHIPPLYRLIIFFPATLTAVGFIQAYFHFCAAFGLNGIYNVLKPAGQTETVAQKLFREKDRNKSLHIIYLSVLVGLLIAGCTFYLPL